MNEVKTENHWISLSDYSIEYDVSVSTLRRWIKANKIQFKLIHGKYFLPREERTHQSQANAPVPARTASESLTSQKEESSFSTAKTVLDELKSAYKTSLKSKEEQIIQLKQQVSDLKTLVMYLEKENHKKM